ncbi:MAG: hypothetical protein HOO91_08515 [Bacteroidales bacterium]|nr:hypothetical protein [Bacteroidales bacterium]
MKTIKQILFILLLFLSFTDINGQTNQGKLIHTIIPAPSLSNNLLYIPTEQYIAVYLPPSYDTTEKSYPVVYYLPGFGDYVNYYTQFGVLQGFFLKNSMDDLINSQQISEMIVVIVNGQHFSGGSFYVNSSVTGNWEDFVVKDVVGYIDKNYRTIKEAKSRAIAGHSMGGFGALNIAMHSPNVFSSVYALAPGLFDKNGLKKSSLFSDEERINKYLTLRNLFKKLPTDKARAKFINYASNHMMTTNDFYTVFDLAYGMAFAPNPKVKVPYIDYPYTYKDNKLVANDLLLKKYKNGFGGWEEKVKTYKTNLQNLHGIVIDVGNQDDYVWIREGCDYVHKLLNENGIKNELIIYDGQHQDKVKERIEKHMLPYISKMFDNP